MITISTFLQNLANICLYHSQDSILGQPQHPTHCWIYSNFGSSCLPAIIYDSQIEFCKWNYSNGRYIKYLAQVWNTRPGGVVVCAPPCSTWVFLSTAVTNRSWSQPQGNGCKCVRIANLMIRRLLYMFLVSKGWVIWNVLYTFTCAQSFTATHSAPATLRLFFAVKRGVYIVLEQPISSVACPVLLRDIIVNPWNKIVSVWCKGPVAMAPHETILEVVKMQELFAFVTQCFH